MGLLFPRKCILCRRLLSRKEQDLCQTCRSETDSWQKGKRKFQFLDSVTAVWYYEENVRRCIVRYKFHGARHLAPGLGRCLAMKLLQEGPQDCDMVTWVPVSTLRRITRGYDQSWLLARNAAGELGIPLVKCLKKIRNNKKQSTLRDAARRRANVLGAYRVIRSGGVEGKKILLIDDVLTTGATAGECARMLLTAGAKEVHCAVIAAARK